MDKLTQHLKPIYQRIAKHPEREDGLNTFAADIRRVIGAMKEQNEKTQEGIKQVMTCLADAADFELMQCEESDLEKYWFV